MTRYPHLKSNIDALNRFGHAAFGWLSGQDLDPERLNGNVFKNAHGMVDFRMPDGKGLFDALPPQGLYQDWVPRTKADTSATIIVGSNVGYGLNHLLMNTPDSHKIIVLEPNAEVLLACLGQTDYSAFLEIKKLHFALPDEGYINEVIRNLDLQFIYGHIHLRGDLPSRQIGPEYARWLEFTRGRLENFSVELTTLRFRQDMMVGNELHNFQRTVQEGSLLPLRGAAEGLGAVILGAGPSLAQFAPALREQRGNALYTTALQTMPALQRFDLKPDLCLAIDFDKSMGAVYDRLDREWAADVPLIYSTKMDPDVVARYPGPTHPLWTLGGMATFVMSKDELVLDAGGNVSLTLVRFLRWCGAAHLLLVGQDLAWKGESSHVAGHHSAAPRRIFNPRQHQKLANLHGEEIISTPQYLAARRELEADLRKTPFPVYNLYGGGVVIAGTRNLTLDEVRTQGTLASAPGSRDRFLEALGRTRQCRRALRFEPRSPRWTSSLRHAEKRLEKLFRKVDRNQDEIHQVLDQALLFVKQDPLYLPYLYNETMNLAGLVKARHGYERKDFSEIRGIFKNVLSKVREVDRCVACPDDAAA